MLKKLALLLGLFLFACSNEPSKSRVENVTNIGNKQQIVIYLRNETGVSGEEINNYVNAQNRQLQEHLKPHWLIDAVVQYNQNPPQGFRVVTLVNGFGHLNYEGVENYLAFHDNHRNGYVDVPRSNQYNSWTSSSSHEILELLVNEKADPTGWEICDPVNNTFYNIDNVSMHNFVFQNYYIVPSQGPWDFNNLIVTPFVPLPGRVNFNFTRTRN